MSLGAGAAAGASRRFAYETWDVFTKTVLTGNPLCVFTDARGMSDAEMQAIARETNLSETTFVLPPRRVRIFSPLEEYPFAGHPTLGTAMALYRPGMKEIVLEENIGPVPVTFETQAGGLVYGEMRQAEPVFSETHAAVDVARLLRVRLEDLVAEAPVVNVSTGRPNLIVMLKSLRVLKALEPDWPAIRAYFAAGDKQRGFYFLTAETESAGAKFHARKLSARSEDPVTGSAAGCAVAYLVAHGMAASGERFVIEQGAEMHRHGELYVTAVKAGMGARDVRVGGYCVKVAQGELSA
jgi:trans-2,3-dihydro-3-hydroxyanthranilate isomerase